MVDDRVDLKTLCRIADVTPRTVHYYIQQGLLPSAGSPGPGAKYEPGHVQRLRLIRRLQREHLPLSEIRARLATMSDAEVGRVLAETEQARRAPADSALDYVRRVLSGDRLERRQPEALAFMAAEPSALLAPEPGEKPPARGRRARAEVSPPPPAGSFALWNRAERRGEPVPTRPSRTPAKPAQEGAEQVSASAPLERSQWERVAVAPDIELHLRRPQSRDMNRRVERLLAAAREIFKET